MFCEHEFVVSALKAEFRMSAGQAHRVIIAARRGRACVVAVCAKDIAEAKATPGAE
jgi:ATP-dependent Clp protease adaptor protein ClpS